VCEDLSETTGQGLPECAAAQGTEPVASVAGVPGTESAESSEALDETFASVFQGLKDLADRYFSRELREHTLQPTALVNELYLRLRSQRRLNLEDHAGFFRVASTMMRRILVDHAKRRNRVRRGRDNRRVELNTSFQILLDDHNVDVLALDSALEKLEDLRPRQRQIVELRYFGGLGATEVAKILGLSKRTVEREWVMAKSWLRREVDALRSD